MIFVLYIWEEYLYQLLPGGRGEGRAPNESLLFCSHSLSVSIASVNPASDICWHCFIVLPREGQDVAVEMMSLRSSDGARLSRVCCDDL